ncbi:hypothetical protein BOO69_17385 [Sulfitobacter alexandrii]|uniref:Flagellar hook-length control protein-like C-terminal domain-containing protein n=1 Tax=Sulfitobacter alexandrii TaxID=1917485 RepID=A0A1J0WLD3_9RHOB|nr:hypothetical protein BOO69_17385 [Sulfitobacter alexandrii]
MAPQPGPAIGSSTVKGDIRETVTGPVDIVPVEAGSPRPVDTLPAVQGQPVSAPQRADMPMHIARQVAEALQGIGQQPVEISLTPEELGRVRLSLSASDSGMIVHVVADRAETLDLMRRHITELSEEFRQLGYADVRFSFAGGGEQHGHRPPRADVLAPDGELPEASGTIAEIALSITPDTGVDIRL